MIAAVGVAYGWLLSEQLVPTDQAVTQWAVTMTALVMTGLAVARLRDSLSRVLAELSDRATHDPLTGVLNRGAFDERVDLARSSSSADGVPISVLAVDIDGFKALNDERGHASGDRVLREVAEALTSGTRRSDSVARVGGDEFAVLLPGAAEADSRRIAEALRVRLGELLGRYGDSTTVSIGVSTGRPPLPRFETLWRAADSAMYEGKRAGGDRVVSGLPLPGPSLRAPDVVATGR